eukprot:4961060-Pyramimonas_sp.AAC.1
MGSDRSGGVGEGSEGFRLSRTARVLDAVEGHRCLPSPPASPRQVKAVWQAGRPARAARG